MDSTTDLHNITLLKEINIVKRNFAFPETFSASSKKDSYSFEFGIDTHIDEKVNSVVKDIIVRVSINKTNEVIAEVRVLFFYEIRNITSHIILEQNNYLLTSEMNRWLNNVSIATTRGVMYSEFKGTFLDKAILPLIDPDTLANV